MKLRTRLIFAFVTVMLIPLILSFVAIIAFGRSQIRSIEKTYGITGVDYTILTNPISALDQVTEPTIQQITATAMDDAKKMDDITYLQDINQKLRSLNSYLVIRKQERIIYAGQEMPKGVQDELPEFGSLDRNLYLGGNLQILIKQADFVFSNGMEGSAFVITNVNDAIPEVKTYLANIAMALIIILAFTAGSFVIWIYRGVAIPIGKMKIATQHIRGGNLDFKLEVETEDELGQLCRNFEDMRVRLKESTLEKMRDDKRNKELISNISHDLKTPITAIKGYVEGIMDGVADTPEKVERYIRTIYNKANEMDMLIDELTLYSQIDANRVPYNFHNVLAGAYFDDCAADLQIEVEARGIAFDYKNYVNRDISIAVDTEQLKRVINNIISNSVKYMDKEDKKISLRVKDAAEFVQVEIEDNGKGIGEEELPYIFERFYRTDTSRNSATGGSGIGLSIVKKIMEDHGGRIWATSREGKGTIMYFLIKKYREVQADE